MREERCATRLVSQAIEGEDTAAVQVRFASGAIGEILTSWAFALPHGTHHIHVVLHGLQGANVGGIVYPSPMPPFGTTLGDADVANIINYERSSWGNHGASITLEQVAAERAKGN